MLEDQEHLDYKVFEEHQEDEEEWVGGALREFGGRLAQMEKLVKLDHRGYKGVQGPQECLEIKVQLENLEMTGFQDLLVTRDRAEILGKMVQPDQLAYLDRSVLPVTEVPLVLLGQEDFKVCLGLQENLENLVRTENLDSLVSLE